MYTCYILGNEASSSETPASHHSSCYQSIGLVTVVHEKERGRLCVKHARGKCWEGSIHPYTQLLPLQDECSFVSLRDVERAMIVFEYFFDKMSIFGPKMDEMARNKMEDMEEVCLYISLSVCLIVCL